MLKERHQFRNTSVDYCFSSKFANLKNLIDYKKTVFITDQNVANSHPNLFKHKNFIVLKPGEKNKNQKTVDSIIGKLIDMGVDKKYTLVGVGGGVITDITGYVASVYMRGIRFGFVPTSILAMVDASIGGKNGIDVGVYKNMVGVIRQPAFILYDTALLKTLPQKEWENGFAEIIKHACILNKKMFSQLADNSFETFKNKKSILEELIRQNALLKTSVVKKDEFELGQRKLLNFGHTIGHAIENKYKLPHGYAVSIGMTYACHISEKLCGFKETEKVTALLSKYGLPTYFDFNRKMTFDTLKRDKKRVTNEIDYVLLNKIGQGILKRIKFNELETILSDL